MTDDGTKTQHIGPAEWPRISRTGLAFTMRRKENRRVAPVNFSKHKLEVFQMQVLIFAGFHGFDLVEELRQNEARSMKRGQELARQESRRRARRTAPSSWPGLSLTSSLEASLT